LMTVCSSEHFPSRFGLLDAHVWHCSWWDNGFDRSQIKKQDQSLRQKSNQIRCQKKQAGSKGQFLSHQLWH